MQSGKEAHQKLPMGGDVTEQLPHGPDVDANNKPAMTRAMMFTSSSPRKTIAHSPSATDPDTRAWKHEGR
jgi:hypothetical protein